MAVGAVIAPGEYTGRTRTEDRLFLALGAYKLGYYLLDLIDIPAGRSPDWAQAWLPVWELADRAVADAIVVYPGIGQKLPAPPAGMPKVPIRELSLQP